MFAVTHDHLIMVMLTSKFCANSLAPIGKVDQLIINQLAVLKFIDYWVFLPHRYLKRKVIVKIAQSDDEILACFCVMKELRPNIEEKTFLADIRLMKSEGYVLCYLEIEGEVVSVGGFRICINLAAEGKALYVYDLITAEKQRSKGHGETLLNGIIAYAKNENCKCVHLDSNVVRHKAHKFYLKNGFDIVAHHFLCKLL